MSVLVISSVVWLVLVFLSVTNGIERNWHQKLTSLHAPVRLSPTERYYSSYFYQVDSIASSSHYTLKTIGEKLLAANSDPYSETADAEIPVYWPDPVRKADGSLLDPVKTAVQELAALQKEIPGLHFQDYEIGGALLKLNVQRPGDLPASLSQMSYLISLPEESPRFRSLLLDPSPADLARLGAAAAPIDFDELPSQPPAWAYFVKGKCFLPDFSDDTPVILPKTYRDAGVLIGDKGSLSYSAYTAASSQEQKIPIRVAGFYDPGLLSVGSKCLIVPNSITRAIYGSNQTFSPDGTPTNGLFVWIPDLKDAKAVKEKIAERFERAGIAPYWKAATYDEFEFSKDLLLQFQSDRTLLLLIAAIILIVACSNIISLLVLLVNDKKKEIAILQSMGASFRSIAAIFGACGIAMGLLSCLLGSVLALFTLKHLDSLVSFLSAIQGRAAFNPAFFGSSLPNQLSFEALLFVLIATPILSLAAGLIPAIKASRIRPSHVLRSE